MNYGRKILVGLAVVVLLPLLAMVLISCSVYVILNGPVELADVVLAVVLIVAGLAVALCWVWCWFELGREDFTEFTGSAIVSAVSAFFVACLLTVEIMNMWLLDSHGQETTCVALNVSLEPTFMGVSATTGEAIYRNQYIYSLSCPNGQPTKMTADSRAWKPGDRLQVIYDPDGRANSYSARDVSRLGWLIAGEALLLGFVVSLGVGNLVVAPAIRRRTPT
jgi:hypothetical protein